MRHQHTPKSSLRAPSPVSKPGSTAPKDASAKPKANAASTTAISKTAPAVVSGTARPVSGTQATNVTPAARLQGRTAQAATPAASSPGKSPNTNKKSKPPARLTAKTPISNTYQTSGCVRHLVRIAAEASAKALELEHTCHSDEATGYIIHHALCT
ncbi:hypothetical protein PINS_up023207 [Pythium insidiosum]|nr:hypothetical protein PINS_up013830 [Pythium insidiosum]GLE10935.1 hypothetical protein PINS_up023207 [Pythium insidiosum]